MSNRTAEEERDLLCSAELTLEDIARYEEMFECLLAAPKFGQSQMPKVRPHRFVTVLEFQELPGNVNDEHARLDKVSQATTEAMRV